MSLRRELIRKLDQADHTLEIAKGYLTEIGLNYYKRDQEFSEQFAQVVVAIEGIQAIIAKLRERM